MGDDDRVNASRQADVGQERQHRQAEDDHGDSRWQKSQRQIKGLAEELVAEVGIGRAETYGRRQHRHDDAHDQRVAQPFPYQRIVEYRLIPYRGEAPERKRRKAIHIEREDKAGGDRREDEGEGQQHVKLQRPVDQPVAVEVVHRPRSL
ncbi:hypothetical protein [Pseudaminobacter salicylatoxidans]|uniref:hypothetical protein n=1 Tax=Pseudaminobacter salicylatoxidans TaxID=93369 RepID=UPI001FCC4890|nr:hypothetical protein [Pseudaminobacter salicylatoxidans]